MGRKRFQSPARECAAQTTEAAVPSGAPAWITRELVELTLRVWQRRYPARLTAQDAVTILLDAGKLFGVLFAEVSRTQALLAGHVYHAHHMTYAGEAVSCGHCGRAVTGEHKTKRGKGGPRHYVYYRCGGYTAPGHPRVRVTEAELDRQMLAVFDRMRVEDEDVREWFRTVLASQSRDAQEDSRAQRAELQRQASLLVAQQDRLLGLRLGDEVDAATFARKHTELRDRLASIKLQLDALDRSHDETAEIASQAFELSQTLRNQWVSADYATKRRILDIVCLNCRLEGKTLVLQLRKPFDAMAEGLASRISRASGI